MNVYFDTEFTGLHKGTTLISIGLIASNGKKFYAEIVDYDRSQVNDWIKENVINNLWAVSKTIDECSKFEYYHLGTKEQIAQKLKEWFLEFDSVQLISDVAHFDMVLLDTPIFSASCAWVKFFSFRFSLIKLPIVN